MREYFLKEVKSRIVKYICDIFVLGSSAYLTIKYGMTDISVASLWLLVFVCNIGIAILDVKYDWKAAEDKFNKDNSLDS